MTVSEKRKIITEVLESTSSDGEIDIDKALRELHKTHGIAGMGADNIIFNDQVAVCVGRMTQEDVAFFEWKHRLFNSKPRLGFPDRGFFCMKKEKQDGRRSNASKGREHWLRKTIKIEPGLVKRAEREGSLTDVIARALEKYLKG